MPFRPPPETRRQMDWLHELYGTDQTVLTVAVESLYNSKRSTMDPESTLTTLADAIYSEVFGHLDDKAFRASKVQEVYDWLEAGDLDDNADVAALADEWREYDADDVAANPA